jgi:hypothetical protein
LAGLGITHPPLSCTPNHSCNEGPVAALYGCLLRASGRCGLERQRSYSDTSRVAIFRYLGGYLYTVSCLKCCPCAASFRQRGAGRGAARPPLARRRRPGAPGAREFHISQEGRPIRRRRTEPERCIWAGQLRQRAATVWPLAPRRGAALGEWEDTA